MSSDTLTQYAALVCERKQCDRCKPDLVNPHQCEEGQHDSAEIGPWTRWQGALDAKLMVIGQDWGDVDDFRKHQGWDWRTNQTNRRLRDLLAKAGFDVPEVDPAVGKDAGRGTVFLTNAILCLKPVGMGAKVKAKWFENCRGFLKQQIQLVRPHALVTLGWYAYESVHRAFFDTPCAESVGAAVAGSGEIEVLPRVRLFPVYHCSGRTFRYRNLEKQKADWRRIGLALRRIQK